MTAIKHKDVKHQKTTVHLEIDFEPFAMLQLYAKVFIFAMIHLHSIQNNGKA